MANIRSFALLLCLLAGFLILFRASWGASYVGYYLDDANYILLAKSLLAGKGYVELASPEEPPHRLYLPGFPLFLLPFVAATGDHYDSLKWINTLLSTGNLALLFLLLRDKLPPILLWPCLATFGANMFVVLYAGSVMSDPLFLFLSLLFFLAHECRERGQGGRWVTAWGMGLLVLLAGSVRVVGLLLLVPVFLSGMRRRDFPLLIGGMLPPTLLLVAAFAYGWVESYGTQLPSTPFFLKLQVFLVNGAYYLRSLILLLSGSYTQHSTVEGWRLALWLLLLPIGYGAIRHWARHGGTWGAYCLAYSLTITGFRLQDPRLLLPVLPFVSYFYFQAVASFVPRRVLRPLALGAALLLAALTLKGILWFFPVMIRSARAQNTPDLASFQWIATHTAPGDVVVSEVASRCFLFTGRKGVGFQRWDEPHQILDSLFTSRGRYLYFTFSARAGDATGETPSGMSDYATLAREDPRHFRLVFRNPEWQSMIYELLPRRIQFSRALLHTNQGAALYHKERLREAEAALRRALTEEPDFYLPMNLLGMVLADSGRLEEGIRLLIRSTSLHPSLERGYVALAYAYDKAGQRSEALAALERARDLAVRQGHPRLIREIRSTLDTLRAKEGG